MLQVSPFAIALGANSRAGAAALASRRNGKALSPWVSIAEDGTITLMSPATEMGQGSMTSLPLILAEELDADWQKVRIVPAPPNAAIYGNPNFGGVMMYTAASNAVTAYFRPLRIFGAQVRRVLLDNAAKHWSVPIEELTTEPSVVVHAKSGRRLTYGEIAAFAEIPAKPPEIKAEDLKKPAQFRLIGKDVMRIELPSKVNGSATYSIDIQLPGMLYGAVLRAPVEGSVPHRIDDAKAKAVAGIVSIVRLPHGVGVVAETPWAAFMAREELTRSVTWTRTGTAWGFDDEQGLEQFAADAKNLQRRAAEWSRQGDARGEFPKAASVIEAEYRCDYAYHAQMEPLNAVAAVSPAGDAVEIWAGIQSQTTAIETPAKFLGIPRDKVKLHDLLMGGGFGRRGNRDLDFIMDAVMLSKEVGRPVKVIWTREDDVHNGRFRPISAHYLRAGLDVSGKITAWHHRIAVDRIGPYYEPVLYERNGGRDNVAMLGGEPRGYDVPHQLVEHIYRDTGVRTNPVRGISFLANKFAIETFIDEIAVKRSIDPLAFRLELLKNNPRAFKTVERVAQMAEWSRKRDGRALGLAYIDYTGSASRRRRRSVARSRQREDQAAQFLVHDRLRPCGATRQRRSTDRKQHRLWHRPRADGAHLDQERCRGAIEFLRLPRPADERGAANAHRSDPDRQPSHGCGPDGDAAGRAGDIERDHAARRHAPAPHAVHPGASQEGVGLEKRCGRLSASQSGRRPSSCARHEARNHHP